MKKIIKIFLVILLLFLALGGGAAYYFYKNIKPVLEKEINNALAVKVDFRDISISGIRDFPNIGIAFSGVKIAESTTHYHQKLLVATELSLFLDVLKLWKGEYVIDAVTLRNGQLNLADLKKGTNYDILKPSTDTSSSPLSFEIKSLTLINCNVFYKYTPDALKLNFFTPKTKIKLKYLDNTTSLGIKSSMQNTNLSYSGEEYITDKNLRMNSALSILADKSFLSIAESDLQIEDIELKTSGTIYYGNSQKIDLKFASNNTTAQSLLSILPINIKDALADIKLSGNVQLNGDLKGTFTQTKSPAFNLNYVLKNAEIAVSGQSVSLSGIDASGTVEMPDIANLKTANASCKLIQAKSNENTLSGDITISNFDMPEIEWTGKANLDVPFLTSLTKDNSFIAKTGNLSITGDLKLRYNPSKGEIAPNSLFFAGNVIGENISGILQNPKLNFQDIKFNISADNSKLVVNSLSFNYNNVAGNIVGYISDYHSLLSSESNSELVGKLEVDNLNVNDLYTETTSASSEIKEPSSLSPIRLNLNSTLRNFQYNDFTAEEISGYLIASANQIAMPECKIKALEGNTLASVALKKWGENYLLDVNTNVTDISITQLFKQFNNFEQNEITDQNLSGKLSGNILAKLILDKNYELIIPKLYAKANITVQNGQLKNYEPLKSLSDFVEVKDLEDIKFKTLQNTIEIFDETIFIPKMRIENSALNLVLEGTHTFENYMNYNMALSVAELLATKANWIAKKKERRIENNANGGLTAHITMVGTPDKLKIAYDGATVKENVKEELSKEKTNFIKALKGETSLEKENSEVKNYDDVWDE